MTPATARRRRRAPATTPADEAEQLFIDIPAATQQHRIVYLERARISPDPAQPRVEADPELRASIARNGLLQPITVRPHPDLVDAYMIVDGERRWRGSEGVLEQLPVIVREDQEDAAVRLRTQLVANTGKALSPLEEAKAYATLLEANGGNQTALAAELGIPRTTLNERLALLELGPWVPLLEDGTLGVSHAVRALIPLRTAPEEVLEKLLQNVLKDWRWHKGDLSVSKFEDLVNQLLVPFMYPLTTVKARAYSTVKNPTFDTRDHDVECTCGGIKWDRLHGFGKNGRRHCVNPRYWRKRHQKGLAEQKKAAASDEASSKVTGPKIVLPDDARTAMIRWAGDTPDGVILLTDQEGRWRRQQLPDTYNREMPFDPADLVIHPGALVRVRCDSYGQIRDQVGLADELAVDAARRKWEERWEARREVLEGELANALHAPGSAFGVDGPGVGKLLQLLARQYAESVVDLADALGIEVSDAVATAHPHELGGKTSAWVAELPGEQQSRLATAMATAAGRALLLTSERLRREQKATLEEIRSREVPWVKLSKKEREQREQEWQSRAARLASPMVAQDDDDDERDEDDLDDDGSQELDSEDLDEEDDGEEDEPSASTGGRREATCIVCGCTDSHACEDGCSWWTVSRGGEEEYGVCTRCAPDAETGKTLSHHYVLARAHAGNRVGESAAEMIEGARISRRRQDGANAVRRTAPNVRPANVEASV